ncbi:DUF4265 domain-containing protein [Pseudoflavitalea sp. G-6-1-2]|uniref:DUF4265 domain-containing protein n=1 Tax=Pseudoflavitalea sp. G-6-1-2 TaxID=2728841 RepID=UPI00146C6477|nr:DUF4265 domain-containing protein [Pseudoflavitalea sp. G-6-1-2]NML19850.1 DUF4265 domain-containing protein [Pseudoflavitalea sp. G-6-1-2]
MSNSKIVFTFSDINGDRHIENLWASQNGTCFRIENIPFFTPGIAYGDIVSVKEINGVLHFEQLIEPSGHSTVQMVFREEEDIIPSMKELEQMGCAWEASSSNKLIALNIPYDVQYAMVLNYLENGDEELKWTFREACMNHN